MDKDIRAVFEAAPSAMLALKEGKIVCANSLALSLLGCREGASFVGTVPEHIVSEPSESFVSSAVIREKSYSARVETEGNIRYISLEPERSRSGAPDILNDSLMSAMLSDVFNVGLAAELLGASLPAGSAKAERYLSALSHSYFCLRHALANLSTAIALKNGSLPFSFGVSDLCRLCSELAASVSIMCSERGVKVEFSTALPDLYAWVDSEKVERIILNLLSNSLMHTSPGGQIRIGLEKRGGNACISVDDTGCGISPSDMSRLFTAYERETELKDMACSGGGLGLGIARGLAEAHDGALIIESREGRGTAVRVLLPIKNTLFNVLESPPPPYFNSGMHMLLTELCQVLDKGCFDRKYRD